MKLYELKAGENVFIDANIFIYSFGAQSAECRELLLKCAKKELTVKKQEIYELFPNCKIDMKRITLAPPIIRLIAPYSWLACYLLEKMNVFNTHYVGVIKKSHRV